MIWKTKEPRQYPFFTKRFAILPHKAQDGNTYWLESVSVKEDLDYHGPFSGWVLNRTWLGRDEFPVPVSPKITHDIIAKASARVLNASKLAAVGAITANELHEEMNKARALVGIAPIPKKDISDYVFPVGAVYGELARPEND